MFLRYFLNSSDFSAKFFKCWSIKFIASFNVNLCNFIRTHCKWTKVKISQEMFLSISSRVGRTNGSLPKSVSCVKILSLLPRDVLANFSREKIKDVNRKVREIHKENNETKSCQGHDHWVRSRMPQERGKVRIKVVLEYDERIKSYAIPISIKISLVLPWDKRNTSKIRVTTKCSLCNSRLSSRKLFKIPVKILKNL